jgi:maltose O-acetyltransferase
VNLGRGVSISLSSRILSRTRGSITVGDYTLIAFKTLIYSYDGQKKVDVPVRVGRNCFIGGGSTIVPGVSIGDDCIVGAGAVVLEDVPDRCIAAGNPARVLRRDIKVGPFGRLKEADEMSSPLSWRT